MPLWRRSIDLAARTWLRCLGVRAGKRGTEFPFQADYCPTERCHPRSARGPTWRTRRLPKIGCRGCTLTAEPHAIETTVAIRRRVAADRAPVPRPVPPLRPGGLRLVADHARRRLRRVRVHRRLEHVRPHRDRARLHHGPVRLRRDRARPPRLSGRPRRVPRAPAHTAALLHARLRRPAGRRRPQERPVPDPAPMSVEP